MTKEYNEVIEDHPDLAPELRPVQTSSVAMALQPVPSVDLMRVQKPVVTAEQAKVNAIADLTHAAYAKASTLVLTAEEQKALQTDFPDEAFKPGAAGKEHLIYIEHAYLRDRFNQVFGPGQWSIIPRSRWAEDFVTDKGKQASRVYVEAMLLIRGCFVSESVGDMVYWKGNDSQNYGDAVEGAKTAALRRCAKELGVGLQAWKKDFGDGWWERRRGRTSAPLRKPEPAAVPAPKPTATPPATTETRARMVERLLALENVGEDLILEYFRKLASPSVLLDTEGLADIPLQFVPVIKAQFESMKSAILDFAVGHEAKHGFPPNTITPAPVIVAGAPRAASPTHSLPEAPRTSGASGEPWFNFIVPVPRRGMKRAEYLASGPDTIGSLYEARHDDEDARKRLFGFVNNYEAKGWTKTNGQVMPASDSDKRFRVMLDQFADWFEKNHPGEKL